MRKYDAIIIGFGKGGKTLAGYLGNMGKKVAMIEKSNKMYGGTCINIGCIPTKKLVIKAKKSLDKGLNIFEKKSNEYKEAIEEKRNLVSMLREKNFNMLNENKNVDVYTGLASFISNTKIKIEGKEEIIIEGKDIFINTGATTIIPNIPGINESNKIYTSTTIMDLDKLPKELVIVGGGYIGLEFSSIYASFGSKVTVIETSDRIAGREDEDVSDKVREILESKGISFILNSKVKEFKDNGESVSVSYVDSLINKEMKIEGDAVLIATGRKPNTEGLNLDNAGVKVNDRGAIEVDNKLRTNVSNIWAIGDVNGGLQFTYVSLDDFRVIKDNLYGDAKRTTDDRGVVPYSVFIDPNLSRVGLSEREAREMGYDIKVAKLQTAAIPRARIIGEIEGFMKAIVDAKTNKILGCTLLCPESSELINIVSIAMKGNFDYTMLRDNIFTHPTMGEALNDLFSLI